MDATKSLAGRTWRHFMHDSLYRNSIYIMSSTLLTSLLGFFFWKINTHFFQPSQIGIATTLISLASLLTNFSMLGINQAIIRALPSSKNKNELVNTSILVVGSVSLLIAVFYMLFISTFSPKLEFIRSNPIFLILFILFNVLAAVNTFTDNVFIAFKKAKYILIENIFSSTTKLLLPITLVFLGAFGIFTAFMGGVVAALCVTFVCFITKLGLTLRLKFNFSTLYDIARYSFLNYLAALLGGSPGLILPIVITNNIGPAESAYYYLAVLISSILTIIPQAVTNALFAEISHDISSILHQVKKALIIISILMIPAVAIVFVLGKYILLFFGSQYSMGGVTILRFLIIGCIVIGVKNVSGTILKAYGTMKEFVYIESLTAVSILGLTFLLIKKHGLVGVGEAWVIGNSITAVLFVIVAYREIRSKMKLG